MIALLCTNNRDIDILQDMMSYLVSEHIMFQLVQINHQTFQSTLHPDAYIWMVDHQCLSSSSPQREQIARYSQQAPLLLLTSTSLTTQETLAAQEIVYSPESTLTDQPQILDAIANWISQLPATQSKLPLRARHLYTEIARALDSGALLTAFLPNCEDVLGSLLDRSAQWISEIPTQMVDYTLTDGRKPGSILRVIVEDIESLLDVRSHTALIASRDQGREDFITALTYLSAVNALQNVDALIPATLSLCDWYPDESVEDFIRRSLPILYTRAAREWSFRFFLKDTPSHLLFEASRLSALKTWLDEHPQIKQVMLAAPPNHERLLQSYEFSLLQLASIQNHHALSGLMLSSHQLEAFSSRLELHSISYPHTLFHLHALITQYITDAVHPPPTNTARATLYRIQAAQHTNALQHSLAHLAFTCHQQDIADYIPADHALEIVQNATHLEQAVKLGWLRRVGNMLTFTYDAYQQYFTARGLQAVGIPRILIYPQFDTTHHRIPTRWDPILGTLVDLSDQPQHILNTIADVDPLLAYQLCRERVALTDYQQDLTLRTLYTLYQTHPEAIKPLVNDLPEAERQQTLLAALSSNQPMLRTCGMTVIQQHISINPQFFDTQWFNTIERYIQQGKPFPSDALLGLIVGACQLPQQLAGECLRLLQQSEHPARVAVFEWLVQHASPPLTTHATLALRELPPTAQTTGMLTALISTDTHAQHIARQSLKPLTPFLAHALSSTPIQSIPTATAAELLTLASETPEEHRATVLHLLQHPDANIRAEAITLLVYFEGEDIMTELEEAQQDTAEANGINRIVRDVARDISRLINGKNSQTPASQPRTTPRRRRSKTETPMKGQSSKILKKRLSQIKSDDQPNIIKQALKHNDPQVRLEAVQQLQQTPHDVQLDHLPPMLYDADPSICQLAAESLGQLGNTEALQYLVDALADTPEPLHHHIVSILERSNDAVIPIIQGALKHSDVNTRAAAAYLLGKLQVAESIDDLSTSLNDRQYAEYHTAFVCDIAAEALESFPLKRAQDALNYWNGILKQETREPQTIPSNSPLAELLRQFEAQSWGEREQTARTIQTLLETEPPPNNAFELLSAYSDHEDWMVRWVVAESLSAVQHPNIIPHLEKMLQDPKWTVKVAVISALMKHQAPAVLFEPAISDENGTVREAAAEALATLAQPAAFPLLATLTQDENTMVRVVAVRAIGNLNTPKTLDVLTKALTDPSPDVRWHAVYGLRTIDPQRAKPYLDVVSKDETKVHWDERRICDVAMEILANNHEKL